MQETVEFYRYYTDDNGRILCDDVRMVRVPGTDEPNIPQFTVEYSAPYYAVKSPEGETVALRDSEETAKLYALQLTNRQFFDKLTFDRAFNLLHFVG